VKDFLREIITEAGRITLAYREQTDTLAVDRKFEKDLVTEADLAVDRFLVGEIKKRFPDHAVYSEEYGRQAGNDYCWVIDPIDGTTSFLHGQPFYSVSIGLKKSGEGLWAAVYTPVLGELFEAEKDRGATLNGKPIKVSRRDRLADSVLATGFACLRREQPYNNLPFFNRLVPQLRDVRRTGSAAIDLSYVACGRLEGFWELYLFEYDVAAGFLILSEAGGQISDFSGGTRLIPQEVLASNGTLHDELVRILHDTKIESTQKPCLKNGYTQRNTGIF